MPKKRNEENQGFPPRWRYWRNGYYYQVPPGAEDFWDGKKQFKLGDNLSVAYKIWADRIAGIQNEVIPRSITVGKLLDRYILEVTPTKSLSTQNGEKRHVKKIRGVFGDVPVSSIKPSQIYKYVDQRSIKRKGADGKTTGSRTNAKLEIALLSHLCTKAVEWGIIDRHPFKGEVRLQGVPPRTRYIEDWEIIEFLSVPAKRKHDSTKSIKAYTRMKLLTALRKIDLLKLPLSAGKEDGIHVTLQKTERTTAKTIIIQWSDELRQAWNDALNVRAVHRGSLLFTNRYGDSYVNEKTDDTSSWDTLWHRYMERALEETKLKERFTEHDLRAKCASDAESLERAKQLLAHADSRITQRVYRRKPELVMPTR